LKRVALVVGADDWVVASFDVSVVHDYDDWIVVQTIKQTAEEEVETGQRYVRPKEAKKGRIEITRDRTQVKSVCRCELHVRRPFLPIASHQQCGVVHIGS
jgi:hypothetical protein